MSESMNFEMVCCDDETDGVVQRNYVEITDDNIILDEALNRFESFLRGCGFVFSGGLEIVDHTSSAEPKYQPEAAETIMSNWSKAPMTFYTNGVEVARVAADQDLSTLCRKKYEDGNEVW